MSGTNAHAVVGEAPEAAAAAAAAEEEEALLEEEKKKEKGKETEGDPAPLLLLCVSAKSEGALRELARRYAAHLADAGADARAACAAAALCRAHMQQ